MTETNKYDPLWLIVSCGCLICLITFGPRSVMGFFQIPIIDANGWSRTDFGLAIAIQNIMWGLGQPFFGAISDRYGTWRVLAIGALIYGLGLWLMSIADSTGMLHLSAGVMIGLGIASGSFSIVMAAFGRSVSEDKRALTFGIGTAAGSAGMALFSPITVSLIDSLGWDMTLVVFAMMMIVIPLLAIPLAGNSSTSKITANEYDQSMKSAFYEAMKYRSYQLLMAGFFVCGFQLAFITAHFPAYITDIGLESRWAGVAMMLIGLMNIFGALAAGFISQRYSMPNFLVLIYIGRAIAVALFLILPQTPISVVIFSMVMGLLWLSTVPPTNALVAIMFGTRYLGLLGGLVFFVHQLGSFFGVWLGGYLYDIFGTFDIVWWGGVVLAIMAAIVHWPIKQQAVVRCAN